MKKNIKFIIPVFLLTSFLTLMIGTYLHIGLSNTLPANGNWGILFHSRLISYNLHYYSLAELLAGEELRLNVRGTYLDIINYNQVKPQRISLRVYLNHKAYFYLVIKKRLEDFEAIRFGAEDYSENAYLSVEQNGRFLMKKELPMTKLSSLVWHDIQMDFSGDNIIIYFDQKKYTQIENYRNDACYIGLIGGVSNTVVDDLYVESFPGFKDIKENFSGRNRWNIVFKRFWFRWAIGQFIFLLVLIMFAKKNYFNCYLLGILVFVGVMIIIGVIIYFKCFQNHRIRSYIQDFNLSDQNIEEIRQFKLSERENQNSHFKKMFSNFKDDHISKEAFVGLDNDSLLLSPSEYKKVLHDPLLPTRRHDWHAKRLEEIHFLYEKKKKSNFVRAIFIGTSQVRGIGANSSDTNFVSQVSREISKKYRKCNIEFINAGISGAHSARLVRFFEQYWSRLGSKYVFVSLGNNDKEYFVDSVQFGRNLKRFIDFSKQYGFHLVFIAEPVNNQHVDIDSFHQIIYELARKHDISFLNLHRKMNEFNHTGILWRDQVHLTQYGHDIAAQIIVDYIVSTDLFDK